MAIFCIPKNLVEKLKNSALRGDVDIKKLYEMSSKERRKFFEEYTDKALGKLINTEFEKAIISKQKTAIKDWAESVFSPKDKKKPVYKNVLDKIEALDDMGVLTPESEAAFLQDLVADKLGVNVSPQEVKIISEKAKKVDEAQQKLGSDVGNPAKLQENIEFFKAKKDIDDYLLGLSPAGNVKVLTGTIGRGMMLASIKSPILNIGSNAELAIVEALSRRLAGGQYRGADNALAKDYVKMVNKVYKETGYDISRMESLSDSGASGQRVLGDTVHAQGDGAIRKAGRVVEDIVFKNLMGAPDVAFSSVHFADSANLQSLKMAKGDKAKAKDIMEDSMRIEPQTPEGEIVRQQAILDAQTATWTNKTWASKVSEGIRSILNEASGDARVGDYLLPFVKTQANVISTGMDYAGLGIPKAMVNTFKAVKNGELGSREYRQSVSRDLVRSGLGITAAVVIASQLKDDDFVGAYDPARSQIEQLRNSNYNAVRIGNKWVSLDWFGPLSVPLASIMYARKYGDTVGEKVFQYGKGVLSSALDIPGVKDVTDYLKGQSYKKNQSLEEMTGEAKDFITSELYSRLVPSFFSDIAKAVDPTVRQTSGGVDKIKAKIPFVSQSLPAKKDIFGKDITGESAISDILFGSRVKTNRESVLIGVINQVSKDTGKGINFTDWDKTSGKTLAQFKQEVGEKKYNKAKIEYGSKLEELLKDAISDHTWRKMTPEERLDALNAQDSAAIKEILDDYDFEYKQDKKK